MRRMGAEGGIVVSPCICVGVAFISSAGMPLMDMKAKDIRSAGIDVCWKPVDFRIDQNASANGEEADNAVYLACSRISHKLCIGRRHLGKGSFQEKPAGIFITPAENRSY